MGEEESDQLVGDRAARYRARAEDARVQARQISRHDVRKIVLRYAEAMEELARLAETEERPDERAG
jgi:hypothetical protein